MGRLQVSTYDGNEETGTIFSTDGKYIFIVEVTVNLFEIIFH